MGQKKSKKTAKNVKSRGNERVDKSDKLASIREEFNPFEVKKTKTKFEVSGREKQKGVTGRPGLSKQVGEDTVGTMLESRKLV